MSAIRLTAKRQATFPKSLCDDMGLHKGDVIEVNTSLVDGERVWILKPALRRNTSWFGRFKRFASGKAHDMQSVRRSIARGRRHGGE